MTARRSIRTALAVASIAALAVTALPANADRHRPHPKPDNSAPQLETLDRGLVAISTDEGVFLSWRLLADEATGASDTGLTGTNFDVLRDGRRIATVTDSTNYLDTAGDGDSKYSVVPKDEKRGKGKGKHPGKGRHETVTPLNQDYLSIPLQRPADGVTPDGEPYTYSANDASVADVDGDGTYELVLKWDPSNSKDVSQIGYTGNVYIDTYELDGTLLNRIDLGVNIRAGAHYTQFLAYDFDGDGKSELMMKTAPGTKSTTYRNGKAGKDRYITMLKQDRRAGYSHSDDYRLSPEGFREHLAEMFREWDTREEVTSGQWPATVEEALGATELDFEHPLSEADSLELADYFITVYGPSRSARNTDNLLNFRGFIVDGPEYLTVFDGKTGRELQTVAYDPPRGDDGLLWGDYAMSRIEPGNRVDRFLAGVGYLDGEHPSAIFARGYYTRTTIAAYDWDGRRLTQRWFVDSGHAPMSNPFNDGPHGVDGTDPVFGGITTQGFHSLSVADVDGDGRHELVYGSATIDDDGSLLYSSYDEMPAESADPGAVARLGHGDAMQVTDIDPSRPGLEIFTVHEGGVWAPYGYALRDAATGEVIYGEYSGRDTGRGMIGDVDPTVPGIETWAWRLRAAGGDDVAGQVPGTNQTIRFSADLTTQIVGGSGDQDVTLWDAQDGTVLTAEGTRSNNGTKGNASLVADILGDWREELVVRSADSSELRVYISTEVTGHKLYTLMHDVQYRAEVARQQTTYNQPSYTGFYLASDMDFDDVPLVQVDRHPGKGKPGKGRR